MAADNETVEDIVREMSEETYAVSGMPNFRVRGLADRIEAAWRRERDELLARLARVEETDRNHLIALTIAEGKLKETDNEHHQ